MKKTALLLVILAVFFVTPARAEEAPAKPSASADTSESSSKAPKDAKDKKGGGSGLHFGSNDQPYVHVDPIVLPLINGNGAEQLITAVIDLQVKNYDAVDHIHDNMPRVRDAIVQALYSGVGDGSLLIGGMIDVVKAKARVLAALEKALGPDVVTAVLVQEIAQRKL